jgi:diacylglycerol kinase (ATP)
MVNRVVIYVELFLARSISEDFSSGDRDCRPMPSRADSESESASTPTSQNRHEKEEETIKVYDGNQGFRRRAFRPIMISKSATVDQILSAGLKVFHITKPTENYYLSDAYDDGAQVSDPSPIPTLKRREGKRPAILLRFRYVILKVNYVCIFQILI